LHEHASSRACMQQYICWLMYRRQPHIHTHPPAICHLPSSCPSPSRWPASLDGGFFLPLLSTCPPAQRSSTRCRTPSTPTPSKYAYTGISLNELTGLVITCAPADLAKNNGVVPYHQCALSPVGSRPSINSLGLSYISITGAALVLVVFIIVFCRTGGGGGTWASGTSSGIVTRGWVESRCL
jgi:hypothetical protein